TDSSTAPRSAATRVIRLRCGCAATTSTTAHTRLAGKEHWPSCGSALGAAASRDKVDRHRRGAREPECPLRPGPWLSDLFQDEPVASKAIEVGREHPVLRTDLAPEPGVVGQPPAFLVIPAIRRPAAGRVAIPAGKTRVQKREHEPSTTPYQPGDVNQ